MLIMAKRLFFNLSKYIWQFKDFEVAGIENMNSAKISIDSRL